MRWTWLGGLVITGPFALIAACVGNDAAPGGVPASGGDAADAPTAQDDAGDAATIPAEGGPPGSSAIAMMSVGGTHACVLRMDGRVFCWGANDKKQLGAGGTPASPVEVMFPASMPPIVPVAIAAGGTFTCIEDDAQRIWCWGDNSLGQLGDDPMGTSPAPNATPSRVLTSAGMFVAAKSGGPALFAGSQGQHACVVAPDGGLLCWGWNSSKQLGYEITGHSGAAQRSSAPASAVESSGSAFNTCAIETSTGKARVACWGRDLEKDLLSAQSDSVTPTFPALPAAPKAIRAGATHACAVDIEGKLTCWGSNSAGQLGSPTIPPCTGTCPGSAPYTNTDFAGEMIIDAAAGYRFTCAVVASGSVYCLGLNSHTQLSGLTTPDADPHATRVKVRAIDDAIAIGAGDRFACALRKTGGPKNGPSPWCWGDNTVGQLGDPAAGTHSTINSVDAVTSYEPVQVKIPE